MLILSAQCGDRKFLFARNSSQSTTSKAKQKKGGRARARGRPRDQSQAQARAPVSVRRKLYRKVRRLSKQLSPSLLLRRLQSRAAAADGDDATDIKELEPPPPPPPPPFVDFESERFGAQPKLAIEPSFGRKENTRNEVTTLVSRATLYSRVTHARPPPPPPSLSATIPVDIIQAAGAPPL